jgi:P27 family predicted phage terminase small subunit
MPRPRKPIAQHRLEGTYERSRHARRQDVAAEGDLAAQPPPAHLTRAERAVWRQVCKVAPAQLLRDADAFLLEAFSCAVVAHRDARAALASSTLLVEARNGAHVVNPLAGEIRRQGRLVAELGSKLGLAPEARLRLMDGVLPQMEVTDPEFRRRYGEVDSRRSDVSAILISLKRADKKSPGRSGSGSVRNAGDAPPSYTTHRPRAAPEQRQSGRRENVLATAICPASAQPAGRLCEGLVSTHGCHSLRARDAFLHVATVSGHDSGWDARAGGGVGGRRLSAQMALRGRRKHIAARFVASRSPASLDISLARSLRGTALIVASSSGRRAPDEVMRIAARCQSLHLPDARRAHAGRRRAPAPRGRQAGSSSRAGSGRPPYRPPHRPAVPST